MDIKKGEKYICLKPLFSKRLEGSEGSILYYLDGRIYTSDFDGCLTDETGNTKHRWTDEEIFNNHFKRVEQRTPEDGGVKYDNDKLPYFTVLFKQFPNAIREIVRCSNAGHNKYRETDGDWQNFSRLSDADSRYKNAMIRHMLEEGEVEDMQEFGGMLHEAAVVWNALADLEIKLRKL